MSEPVARVLFFAAARDAAGVGACDVPVPAQGCTVGELADEVLRRFPALAPYRRAVRFAVNGEYARDTDRVRPGDEVAVIPPVAGG